MTNTDTTTMSPYPADRLVKRGEPTKHHPYGRLARTARRLTLRKVCPEMTAPIRHMGEHTWQAADGSLWIWNTQSGWVRAADQERELARLKYNASLAVCCADLPQGSGQS